MFITLSTLFLPVKPVKRFNGNIVTFLYINQKKRERLVVCALSPLSLSAPLPLSLFVNGNRSYGG